ncbi:MAG: type II secretion system F family protein [Erysipelotrichaceae bacterium]|nr:type II secretion system F family protein [Erysipelotrichaceae bacterium]
MITKDNVITLAYKGLAALILSIFRKKDKIKALFIEEEVVDENLKTITNRLDKASIDKDQDKITFKYKTKLKNGKVSTGTFDAYNIEQAKNYLINEGYELVSIVPVKKNSFDLSSLNLTIFTPIKMGELSFALTQISTYLKAGMSLVDAFRILAKQSSKPSVRKIYNMIVYDLLSGESLSTALEHQPNVFPKLLTNMVRSAELTGDLPAILDDMADYYTSIDKTKKELKSAMTYPTIVLIMAIAVIIFVLRYIVPEYVAMFSSWSDQLPKITVMTISFSNFLQDYLLQLIIIIIMILLLYIYWFKNVKSFKYLMQLIYLKIPVVKNIIIYSEVSMFSKTFASLLNHGVFITDSMDVLLKVSDNEIYKRIIENTVHNLNRGGKISEAFKDNPYIPVVAYEMIVTGESTGKLGTMMEKVADYYQNLYRNSINQVKTLLEPILIVFLTFTVGIIIISIIVPMFEMYKVIS